VAAKKEVQEEEKGSCSYWNGDNEKKTKGWKTGIVEEDLRKEH
jgi:hypothetical protein